MLMANPLRIEGPDPPAMTCADVERWLVAAFMAFTSSGIFSVRPNRLQPNDPQEMRATFDWIVFRCVAPLNAGCHHSGRSSMGISFFSSLILL